MRYVMGDASSRVTTIPLRIVLSALGMCQLVAEFSVRQKVIQIRYRQLHIPLMDAAFCLDHSPKPSSSGIQQQAQNYLVPSPWTRMSTLSPFIRRAKHSPLAQMTKALPSGTRVLSTHFLKTDTPTTTGWCMCNILQPENSYYQLIWTEY